ncbi:hypothetical protein ACIPVB_02520 [Microbacterium sp. NPDC090007]|uniref:hypothetical protein n=1 Tax=Microbacterium sp. NPDC090007 TaxID=3364204 RepID=UPI0038110243
MAPVVGLDMKDGKVGSINRDAAALLRELLGARVNPGNGAYDQDLVVPDFEEDAPLAWPYYAAMLDLAEQPGVVEWLGWQQIMYYLRDGQKEWPQAGLELVNMVADSARQSARVGQFLCQRLLLDLAEGAPGVAVLAVEILNDIHDWGVAENLLSLRDGLLSSPDPFLTHQPASDFQSPSLRGAIVRPFDIRVPLGPFRDMTAWRRWSDAVQSAAPSDRSNSELREELLQALAAIRVGDVSGAPERSIVRALNQGVDELGLCEDVLSSLAATIVSFELGDGRVTGLALVRLLEEAERVAPGPAAVTSVWRALHSPRPPFVAA